MHNLVSWLYYFVQFGWQTSQELSDVPFSNLLPIESSSNFCVLAEFAVIQGNMNVAPQRSVPTPQAQVLPPQQNIPSPATYPAASPYHSEYST